MAWQTGIRALAAIVLCLENSRIYQQCCQNHELAQAGGSVWTSPVYPIVGPALRLWASLSLPVTSPKCTRLLKSYTSIDTISKNCGEELCRVVLAWLQKG